MPSSPPNSSPSPSKPNSIKSFVRKKFLDTSLFSKSYKFDKEISNSIQENNDNNRKSIAIPILISNPSKYYKDVDWKSLIKEKFPTSNNDNNDNVSSRRNSAMFRFKPSPKQISSIDNVLSPPNNEVNISLLATSPDSDIQFDQYNTDEWKEFLYNYAQGRFNPIITPKKPNSLRRNKTVDCRRSKVVCELDSSAEANVITSFIKGLEDDCDQNKCLSEDFKDFDDNYENNCYQFDDDELDSSHYLPPPMPPNEVERRRALWRFQILNTSNDVNFARIVALSKEHFKTSISMISLLNTTHQWFKAEDGMGCSQTTREISFCGHAILQQNGEPFVVLDAKKDWRFRNNPLVTDSPFIRFYAGAPLQTDDGYNIGTICVIDREPRDSFSKKDRENLKDYAKVVMRELELWTDTLRLRVRNKMQESIAEFSKFCLEIQLANNSNNDENKLKPTIGDPIMKQCFNMAVKLMRDTLNVNSVYLLEMPCLYSRPLSITSRTSNNFFLNAPPPDVPSSHLRSLASVGDIELSNDSLKTSIITSYFTYIMQAHSQGCIYQNSLPPLPTLFPDDVQSGIVVPIYDDSQNAFGFLIAMTKDPHRQFEDEERVYLSNFGVNVVSEVLKRRVIVADRAKGAFISSISHELRTPLHGILASCELMEESKLSDAQAELVKTIQGCGTSLISIINSVLDFAKLESEKQDYVVDDPLNQKKSDVKDNDNKVLNRNNKRKKEQKERIDLVKLLEEVSEACFVGQQMVTAIYNDNNKIINSTNKNDDNEENFLMENNNNNTAITQARKKRVYDLLHPHQSHHQKADDVLLMIDVEPREAGWWVMAEDGALKQLLMNVSYETKLKLNFCFFKNLLN
jgi:signal transduction histidine kinase